MFHEIVFFLDNEKDVFLCLSPKATDKGIWENWSTDIKDKTTTQPIIISLQYPRFNLQSFLLSMDDPPIPR
jgi:hypothetical protein